MTLLIDQWVYSLGFKLRPVTRTCHLDLWHPAWRFLSVYCLSRLFWNTVCFWQGSKIICVQYVIFLLVPYTLFEVYSYLFGGVSLLTVNYLPTLLAYLFTYINIIYHFGVRQPKGQNVEFCYRSTFGSFDTFFWVAYGSPYLRACWFRWPCFNSLGIHLPRLLDRWTSRKATLMFQDVLLFELFQQTYLN